MTKLEKLADIAKKAQRDYEDGEIQAYSDKQGFSWNCNADGESVVRHTLKTIESAFTALDKNEGSELHSIMLAMGIMRELQKIAFVLASEDD